MTWQAGLWSLIGLIVGWVLNEWSDQRRFNRQWRGRLRELKIEAYAEWAAGMDASLVAYARQVNGGASEYRVPLCEQRLLLIERDAATRRMIQEVHDSIPGLGTDDFEELARIAHSDPDWDWAAYRETLNKLLDHVRGTVS